MCELKQAIEKAGGVALVANGCNISPRAVYKWLAAGRLPRTDYTGETDYAERICALASMRGTDICPIALRNASRACGQPTSSADLEPILPSDSHIRQCADTAVQASSAEVAP